MSRGLRRELALLAGAGALALFARRDRIFGTVLGLGALALAAFPGGYSFRNRAVVITGGSRGLGLARGLYDEVFAAAAQAGHWIVGCEVNVEPPNPVSDAFHEALGFAEVGRAPLCGGQKVVRYLVKPV